MSEEKRPEWLQSISGTVDPDEYLLGRKIDKTFELVQQEKAEKAREARVNLLASDRLKLSADPILELERRRHQLKMEIISNPIKLRQLRERLLKEEREAKNRENPSFDETGQRPKISIQYDRDSRNRDTRIRDSRDRYQRREHSRSRSPSRSSRTRSRYHSPESRNRDSRKDALVSDPHRSTRNRHNGSRDRRGHSRDRREYSRDRRDSLRDRAPKRHSSSESSESSRSSPRRRSNHHRNHERSRR